MDQKKIVALAVLSGVPVLGAVAAWMFLQGNTIPAYALGAAALGDLVVGVIFLTKK